jgi:hypothetical protein
MYDVHDWAEVHRLHHVEGLSKAAVAVSGQDVAPAHDWTS